MDSWKVDARQRLIDHVLVYSEVQFQRAEMKARGIDTGGRKVTSSINYWYQMWLVVHSYMRIFRKARDTTFSLDRLCSLGKNSHRVEHSSHVPRCRKWWRRKYSVSWRLDAEMNWCSTERYLIQSTCYPDSCFWNHFTKTRILLLLSNYCFQIRCSLLTYPMAVFKIIKYHTANVIILVLSTDDVVCFWQIGYQDCFWL